MPGPFLLALSVATGLTVRRVGYNSVRRSPQGSPADGAQPPDVPMSRQFLVHSLAVIGTVLYVIRALPATVQLARGRGVDPNMARTLGLLVLTGLWWTTYSYEIGNWPTFGSSALSLVAPAYALALLWRQREVQRGVALVIVIGVIVSLLEVELRPPRAVGVTAAVGSAALTLPETIRLIRHPTRSAADTSLGTWVLMAVNAAVWLVYAILIRH